MTLNHRPQQLNPLATELNAIIGQNNSVILRLLSESGLAFYFPKTGILGQSAEAKGKTINATIGIATEDNGSPVRLAGLADLIKLEPKEIFPYAPSYGKPELRKKWQELIKLKNPSLNSPLSLPVVTNALTHGLTVCATLFVNPGDKIIIADKLWGNYRLIFELGSGGILDPFNTFNNQRFDIESFKAKLAEKANHRDNGANKKIILLNFPNNPSGYTPTTTEVEQIVAVIGERAKAGDELVVLLDDAYFGLVYEEGIIRESLFSKLANLDERVLAVKIDGVSKEEYAWGLRVGFLTYGVRGGNNELYQALEAKTAGIIRGQISNVSHLSQSLILACLNSPGYAEEKQKKFDLLKSRYLAVKKALTDPKYTPAFTALPFNSGYFMCLQLAHGLDAEKVRRKLLEKYDTGVIALPGNLLRLAFSSVAVKNIPKLIENIYSACLEINKLQPLKNIRALD